MVRGLVILLVILFAGEAISAYLHLPVPGNVIGFVLLFLLLLKGVVSVDRVAACADFLVKHLLFLFLPAIVGTMTVFDVINRQLAAFMIASFVSTFLVMACSAKVIELLARRLRQRGTGNV